MSILTIEDRMVHYEAIGHGQPLIFIHGWIGSWRYWWPTMQAMANTCRTFAIDLWGYGDSSRWPEKYTLEEYSHLIEAFLTGLGVTRPVYIAGHSLGAAVALKFAASRPHSVRGIMAVSAPVNNYRINGALAQSFGPANVTRLIGRDSPFQSFISELAKTDETAVTQTMDQLNSLNLDAEMRIIDCPVILVAGSRDPIVEQIVGERECPEHSNGAIQCISMDDCYHFPMLEDPVVFNRLLKEFVHGADVGEITPKRYWRRRTR